MPSSSENDNEEVRAKLCSAVDPAFVVKKKKRVDDKINGEEKSIFVKNGTKKFGVLSSPSSSSLLSTAGKSIRELLNCEEDFPKPYSLNVTPDRQKFIAKKLSAALDKIIEDEVVEESSSHNSRKAEKRSGIFLFKSSGKRISSKDLQPCEGPPKKQKKPNLKRKRHVDGSEEEDEDDKLRAVAVSADWVKQSVYY